MDRYIGLDAHSSSCTLGVLGPGRKPLGSHVVETNAKALIEIELADHHTVSDRLLEDAGLYFIALYSTILGSETFTDRILVVRLRALGAAQDFRPTCRAGGLRPGTRSVPIISGGTTGGKSRVVIVRLQRGAFRTESQSRSSPRSLSA